MAERAAAAAPLARKAFVVSLVGALTLGALAAGWYAREVLLLTFGGWLLSLALGRVAEFVARHTPLGRRTALAAVLLLVVLPLAVLLAGFVAGVAGEVIDIARRLPAAFQQLQARAQETGLPLDFEAGRLRPAGIFSNTVGAIGAFLYVCFMAIFFAAEPDVYRRGLLALLPAEHRRRARQIVDRVAEAMERWLVARLLLMLFVAVVTTVALSLLGVPNALGLGALAGLLDFIPNIGPVLAGLPAVLLTFDQGLGRVLAVAAMYLGVQTAEAYLLSPLVERRAVRLAPGLILLAQALLGFLAGWLGLMFATPLTAAVIVVYNELRGEGEPEE